MEIATPRPNTKLLLLELRGVMLTARRENFLKKLDKCRERVMKVVSIA
jgi:hypothetical protein